MSVLEARARVLGGFAVALGVGAVIVTQLVGPDVWTVLPNHALIGVVVALPGFLLGRTGLTARPGVLAYETILAVVAGAVVAMGVLAALALAGVAPENGLVALVVHIASTAASWAPYGVAGYVLGLLSTLAA